MQLFLAQHGHAVNKSIDAKRPLSERGHVEVNGAAIYLQQSGAKIKNIYHSGKPRAQQTATIFADILDIQHTAQMHGINPNDDVKPITEVINSWTTDSMLVGHFPFLPHITHFLLTGTSPTDEDYLPGNIVCLEKGVDNLWLLAGSCAYTSFCVNH